MNKFAINVALTVIVGGAIVLSLWQHSPAIWNAPRMLGLILLIIGFVFWTVARFQLGASLTVTAQAHKLVSRGLYSRIRNPIYVFGSSFIAGFILLFAPPAWLLVFAVIIPMQIWRAGKEAKVLEATFGDEYRRYRRTTWF